MMSVTANHVVFALSFASVFFVCYVGSQFLSSVLNGAGYDFVGTILNLEKQPENMSSQLLKDFSSNQLAQLVAIALTALTSVVFFLKFSKSMFGLAGVRWQLMRFPRVEATSVGSSELARIPTHKKDHHFTEYCHVSCHKCSLNPRLICGQLSIRFAQSR